MKATIGEIIETHGAAALSMAKLRQICADRGLLSQVTALLPRVRSELAECVRDILNQMEDHQQYDDSATLLCPPLRKRWMLTPRSRHFSAPTSSIEVALPHEILRRCLALANTPVHGFEDLVLLPRLLACVSTTWRKMVSPFSAFLKFQQSVVCHRGERAVSVCNDTVPLSACAPASELWSNL